MGDDASEPFSVDAVSDPLDGWLDVVGFPGDNVSVASSVTGSADRPLPSSLDLPPSSEDMGRALFDAHSAVAQLSQPRLPWESGVFSWIFGSGPSVVPMPFQVAEVPSLAAQLPISDLPDTAVAPRKRFRSSICSGVLKARTDEDAEDEKHRLWVTTLNKWLLVLRLVNFSGTVGAAVQLADSEESRLSIIRDALGTRSPRTAIKRANSILRWLKWSFQAGYEVWPPTAAGLRNFLTDDGSISVAPSACGALLEALRFCKHVMHMVVPDDAVKDPIVIGRCARMMAEKQVVKQARPLLVREVEKLERFMSGDNEPWDIYMVGCCLFAIFSRSRWSDLEYMDELYVDRSDDYPAEADGAGELFGFVEGRTRRHKGATTAMRKRRQMPIVSPLLGVSGVDWTAAWLESMTGVGFDLHARPLGALCRPPLPNGQLARGSCSSEDIGAFLTRVLELTDQDAITSHSMKATTLAWAAKFGIDESARLLLGHHSVGGRSLATYSRDMLGRPLMLYSGMLASIRSGQFEPDTTRSGWLAPDARAIATQAGCPATPMAPVMRGPGTPMAGGLPTATVVATGSATCGSCAGRRWRQVIRQQPDVQFVIRGHERAGGGESGAADAPVGPL